MNTRLNQIQNWSELAEQAGWSVSALARKCGVTVRTLHRHFREQIGKSTKLWLAEQRQCHGVELLTQGSSIKETASSLAYKQPTNFARQYKKHWGICPSLQQAAAKPAQTQECPQMIQNVRK